MSVRLTALTALLMSCASITSCNRMVAWHREQTCRMDALSSAEQEMRATAATGRMRKAAIQEVVCSHRDDLHECYERHLRSRYQTGRLKLFFEITPAGFVGETHHLGNATGIEPLPCCIAAKMRRWEFPSPEGGNLWVTYPVTFLIDDGQAHDDVDDPCAKIVGTTPSVPKKASRRRKETD